MPTGAVFANVCCNFAASNTNLPFNACKPAILGLLKVGLLSEIAFDVAVVGAGIGVTVRSVEAVAVGVSVSSVELGVGSETCFEGRPTDSSGALIVVVGG